MTTYAANFPTGITTSDLDGDGDIDLAVTNTSPYNTVSVMLGNGDGTFAAPQPFTVVGGPHGPAAADLDGDFWPDLVTANFSADTVSVLINLTCPGDFDGDSDVDSDDYDAFKACFTGPGGGLIDPGCIPGDFDGDEDVDCDDWEEFKNAWTGPPANPPLFFKCDRPRVNPVIGGPAQAKKKEPEPSPAP